MFPINWLPKELEQVVLSYLGENDLAQASLVSKIWKKNADHEELYENSLENKSLEAKKACKRLLEIPNEINLTSLIVEDARASLLRNQVAMYSDSLFGRLAFWMDDHKEILGRISLIFFEFLFENFESFQESVLYQRNLNIEVLRAEMAVLRGEDVIADLRLEEVGASFSVAGYRKAHKLDFLFGGHRYLKVLPFFDNSQHKSAGTPYKILPSEVSHPIMRMGDSQGNHALLLNVNSKLYGNATICAYPNNSDKDFYSSTSTKLHPKLNKISQKIDKFSQKLSKLKQMMWQILSCGLDETEEGDQLEKLCQKLSLLQAKNEICLNVTYAKDRV